MKSTPFRIGNLTCLKTLSIFIVSSITGHGLADLHNLQLGGKLHIKGLQKVSNEEDARKANLIGKKDLNHLYLSWGDYASSKVSCVDAEQVLEALEPHSGLKNFGVQGYTGTQFPCWMKNISILNGLVSIILYDCKNCRQLPPFGKLPCLTTLFVSGMRDIKYIDDDVYEPATKNAFTSLKKLTLCDLQNLERVLEFKGVEMLPQLLELYITNVPKLTLPSLPSVESLSADGGKEEFLKSIVNNSNMYNLKSLCISSFDELKELPVELSTLSALESLEIRFCNQMELFSEQLLQGLSSLKTLRISYCPQFVFPDNMNSLTSLRKLDVWKCNEHVLDSLGTSFSNIPSLQNLSLYNFPSRTSLPDWLGAMTSLQVLDIDDFPKLKSLPDNFQQLQNLQELSIAGCPMLSSLPDNFQQLRNLQKLTIQFCPELKKRCKRGIGEDWHKISHIPELDLNLRTEEATCCGNLI